MLRISRDQIGESGELLVATELSRPAAGRYRRPLFRARPLGEKYPVVDFIIDILSSNSQSIGFFFAQVKTTNHVRAAVRLRLPVTISKTRFNSLVKVMAPSYLIGVDMTSERTYIVAATKTRQRPISSITKAYNLGDDKTKIELYKEVRNYWQANRSARRNSVFIDGG